MSSFFSSQENDAANLIPLLLDLQNAQQALLLQASLEQTGPRTPTEVRSNTTLTGETVEVHLSSLLHR